MKKILKLLIAVTFLCTTLFSQSTLGLTFELMPCGTGYEVSRGTATDYKVIIPELWNELPVRKIADRGFSFFHDMTEIYIPNSVTDLGSEAFSQTGLLEIIIPSSITHIPEFLFSECNNLRNVSLPKSVKTIDDWAFFKTSSLAEISLPNSIVSIGVGAFALSGIIGIEIPNSVMSIDDLAFMESKINFITIPMSVTHIYGTPFFGTRLARAYIGFQSVPSSWSRYWGTDLRGIEWGYVQTSPPKNLTVFENNGAVVLNWEAPWHNTTEVYEYKIYRDSVYLSSTKYTSFIDINVLAAQEYTYHIKANYKDGDEYKESRPSNQVSIIVESVFISDVLAEISIIKRLRNYPNPFNPYTNIQFTIGNVGNVVINVYNVRGQRVRTLLNEQREPGHHSLIWNGTDDSGRAVGSGVYFYRVSARNSMNDFYTSSVGRMLLMK